MQIMYSSFFQLNKNIYIMVHIYIDFGEITVMRAYHCCSIINNSENKT